MDLDLPSTLSERSRSLLTATADQLEREYGDQLLGLVLSGSAAHGLDTEHSDLDLDIILTPEHVDGPRLSWLETTELEPCPMTLQDLETVASYGSDQWGYRWSYAWAPVLADRTGGRVAKAIEKQTHLTTEETTALTVHRGRIGAWINLSYRALKSARDGRLLEASLDASEAVPPFLDVVFALNGLVRPYNKYLPWALKNHPLTDWTANELLALIDEMRHGSPQALKRGLARAYDTARQFDTAHGQTDLTDVFNEWSADEYRAVLGLPS